MLYQGNTTQLICVSGYIGCLVDKFYTSFPVFYCIFFPSENLCFLYAAHDIEGTKRFIEIQTNVSIDNSISIPGTPYLLEYLTKLNSYHCCSGLESCS